MYAYMCVKDSSLGLSCELKYVTKLSIAFFSAKSHIWNARIQSSGILFLVGVHGISSRFVFLMRFKQIFCPKERER